MIDNLPTEDDWDFDTLQYIWHTLLKRNEDFEEQTPKNLFGQLKVHIKMNKQKEQ